MIKTDNSLFKIGEVTKIMGITRKTLLVYEEIGLLTPALKDAETQALCIYFRGSYEGTPIAMRALMDYVVEHGIQVTVPVAL